MSLKTQVSMNPLAHICFNYVVLSIFIPEINQYIWPLVIFSTFLDLDHIPGAFRMMKMSREQIKKMTMDDHTNMFRRTWQEPLGIVIMEVVLAVLYVAGVDSTIIVIGMASILLHWFIDFVTVHTQPFKPKNKRIVALFFNTAKQRWSSEVILTAIFMIGFFMTWARI